MPCLSTWMRHTAASQASSRNSVRIFFVESDQTTEQSRQSFVKVPTALRSHFCKGILDTPFNRQRDGERMASIQCFKTSILVHIPTTARRLNAWDQGLQRIIQKAWVPTRNRTGQNTDLHIGLLTRCDC